MIYNNSIIHFLKKIEHKGIDYIIWKNIHEIGQALSGRRDLDVYINCYDFIKFDKIAKQDLWVKLKNPVADYPNTHHYYKYSNDSFYHIHLYTKVITGESWLKEFIFDINDLFFKNKILHKKYKIWILNDPARSSIFLMRHLLKNASLTSRLTYKLEYRSYLNEWSSIRKKKINSDFQKFFNFSKIDLKFLQSKHLEIPSPFTSLIFRFKNYSKLRFFFLLLPFLRIFNFLNRLLNKVFYKNKKIFCKKGFVVSICGVDGSGKSTLVRGISNKFSEIITVRKMNLGNPFPYLLNIYFFFIKTKRATKNEVANFGMNNTLFFHIKAIVLVLLRIIKSLEARRYKANGFLVISDRWPSQIEGMYGPKNTNLKTNFLVIFTEIEKYLYKKIFYSDLSIFLKVSLDNLLYRNRQRNKANKENDNEIILRYRENYSRYISISTKTIYFENNSNNYRAQLDKIMRLLWSEICKYDQ